MARNESQGFLGGLDAPTRRFGHAVRKQLDRLEEQLTVGEIISANYAYTSGPFSDAGSRFDLSNGDLVTTGLFVDGTTGDVDVRGNLTALSLSLTDAGGTEVAVFGESNEFTTTGHGFIYTDPNWTDPLSRAAVRLHGHHLGSYDNAGADLYAKSESHSARVTTGTDDDYAYAGLLATRDVGDVEVKTNAGWIGGLGGFARLSAAHDPGGGWKTALVDAGVSMTGATLVELSADNVEDQAGRQFIRSESARTNPMLIQSGTVTATTDANGLLGVGFNEAYSFTPDVVAIRQSTSAGDRSLQLHAVGTTGFQVRIMNSGALLASSSATIHWIASGAKVL